MGKMADGALRMGQMMRYEWVRWLMVRYEWVRWCVTSGSDAGWCATNGSDDKLRVGQMPDGALRMGQATTEFIQYYMRYFTIFFRSLLAIYCISIFTTIFRVSSGFQIVTFISSCDHSFLCDTANQCRGTWRLKHRENVNEYNPEYQ